MITQIPKIVRTVVPRDFQWFLTFDDSECTLAFVWCDDHSKGVASELTAVDFSGVLRKARAVDWAKERISARESGLPGAGGGSPPERPAAAAQAGETGRRNRRSGPVARQPLPKVFVSG